MYVYTNDLLTGSMNDFDVFFGESGYVNTDATWHSRNVCSPFSRLYYVDGGLALLRTPSGELCLEPGKVYLIPAGLTYDYEGTPSVSKLFFHVNLFKPDGYDLMLDFHEVGVLDYSKDDTASLNKLYAADSFTAAVLLKSAVTDTLARMIRKYGIGAQDTGTVSPLVQGAMNYIQKHLSVKLNTAEVADHVFVSVSTLSKAFKAQTGRTVGAYIDDLVMYSAQRALLHTDLALGVVSEQLGFCDQFYFSRYFKRRCGESPLRYRKRMRTVDFGDEPHITPVNIRGEKTLHF